VALKLAGKKLSKTTKANGIAKLKVPGATKAGRYPASARKGGYAPGKRRIRVIR